MFPGHWLRRCPGVWVWAVSVLHPWDQSHRVAALIQLTQINWLSSRFRHLERCGVNTHYFEKCWGWTLRAWLTSTCMWRHRKINTVQFQSFNCWCSEDLYLLSAENSGPEFVKSWRLSSEVSGQEQLLHLHHLVWLLSGSLISGTWRCH